MKILVPFLIFLLTRGSMNGQEAVNNTAFKAGEQLVYQVNYISAMGDIQAGKAVIDVEDWTGDDKLSFPKGYRIVGRGTTTTLFDIFFKVRDSYETFVDTRTLTPYRFIRSTQEGNYAFDDDVIFDQENNTAESIHSKQKIEVPENVHDIISAVFFMRTLTVEDFGNDSVYYLNFFLDDSVYYSAIKYEGKAILKTKWGWLPCVKVKPMLATGEVFSRKYPMTVWITDDKNHIPLLAESDVIVGKVQMRLDKFSGLKNPFIEAIPRKELKNYQ